MKNFIKRGLLTILACTLVYALSARSISAFYHYDSLQSYVPLFNHDSLLSKRNHSNEVKNSSQGNLFSALTGRVAGVKVTSASGHFAGGSRITVRGLRSVTDNNQPLIIVDGVPYSNIDYSAIGLSVQGYDLGSMVYDLNLWDIDSIDILSPNQSTIFGFQGRNGVVQIHTKTHNYSEKLSLKINYNTSFSVENVAKYPDLQKKYGGGLTGLFETANINGQDYLLPEYRYDESWGPKYDQSIRVLHWNAFDAWDSQNFLVPKPWVYPKNDYRNIFNKGVDFQNNIQVKASYKFFTLNASYTNRRNNGIYPSSKFSTNNLNVNTSLRYREFVELFASFTYSDNETEGRVSINNYYNNPIGSLWQWSQTSVDYDDLKIFSNPDGSQRAWNRVSWNDPSPTYLDNPFWALKNNFQSDSRDRYFFNSQIQLNPFKWLLLNGVVGYDTYKLKNQNRVAVGSVNLSRYGIDKFNFDETFLDFFALFHESFFNDNLSVGVKVGVFKTDGGMDIFGGETKDGLLVPNDYSLSNSTSIASLYSMRMEKSFKGFYSEANIGFSNSLYMNLTLRNDKVDLLFDNYSLFTKGLELRYIPKVNSELVSRIEFFGGYNQIDNLFTSANDVNPEKITSVEVGTDISIQGFFALNISYYRSKTESGIIYLPIPMGDDVPRNMYNSKNNGLVLSFTGKPIMTNKFKWITNLHLTHQKIKVTKLYQGIESLVMGYNLMIKNGESFPMIFGTDYVKDSKGNIVVNPNGQFAVTELKPLAKVNPDLFGGFTNSFEYKNFQLNILLDFQIGGNMYYSSYKWGLHSGLLNETVRNNELGNNIRDDIDDGGGVLIDGVYGYYNYGNGSVTYADASGNIVANPINNTTRISALNWSKFGPDSRNVFSTDFIKIREISLSYIIPTSKMSPVKSVKVSVFARNIYTWTNGSKHFDPEYMQLSSNNAQGYESVYLPSTRTFGCMLNMSF